MAMAIAIEARHKKFVFKNTVNTSVCKFKYMLSYLLGQKAPVLNVQKIYDFYCKLYKKEKTPLKPSNINGLSFFLVTERITDCNSLSYKKKLPQLQKT